MTKIISFANQKGGVGKTTTAVNLSAALAEAGQSVLAIDFDPQGNLSSGLGIDKTNTEKTIYEVIIGNEDINDTILNTEVENLDIIPSNVDLSGAEIELLELEDRERTLRRKIGEIYKQYDYILIDCPPSLSLLTINAFMASDSVIIPIQCAKTAGYRQLELEVVAENKNAIALYKKFGFKEIGRNPRGFCSRYTGWQELISMLLVLD